MKTYALLTRGAHGWHTEALLGCRGVDVRTFAGADVGLPPLDNPYNLAVVSHADVALVTAGWYRWLTSSFPDRVDRVFSQLRQRAAAVGVLDGVDMFKLGVLPDAIDRCDVVLKGQGLYRDRELYNYEVGCGVVGANWTEKRVRSSVQYTPAQLEKLRLSVPCFLLAQRGGPGDRLAGAELAVRRALTKPSRVACLLATLTHIQRLELLEAVRDAGISGALGITRIPRHVLGTPSGEGDLPAATRRELEARLSGLQASPVSRTAFRRTLIDHRVALAPVGYGELTPRHAEGWMQGRLVLCQDVTHVETRYPMRDRENVVFCRPDLSDVVPLLRAVAAGEIDWRTIGACGRRVWRSWLASVPNMLEAAFVEPFRSGEQKVQA